tara:strand:+ start:329 stop:727 length:399 start_codon:yes stop_codon:yes gene_type:complete
MTKRKPEKVIEYRISLQDKEREMVESLTTAMYLSSGAKALDALGIDEITKMLDDPTKLIQVFYSIAMILEAMGFETGLPTPMDFGSWYGERQSKLAQMKADREAAGGDVSVVGQVLDTFRTLFGVDPSERWN